MSALRGRNSSGYAPSAACARDSAGAVKTGTGTSSPRPLGVSNHSAVLKGSTSPAASTGSCRATWPSRSSRSRVTPGKPRVVRIERLIDQLIFAVIEARLGEAHPPRQLTKQGHVAPRLAQWRNRPLAHLREQVPIRPLHILHLKKRRRGQQQHPHSPPYR